MGPFGNGLPLAPLSQAAKPVFKADAESRNVKRPCGRALEPHMTWRAAAITGPAPAPAACPLLALMLLVGLGHDCQPPRCTSRSALRCHMALRCQVSTALPHGTAMPGQHCAATWHCDASSPVHLAAFQAVQLLLASSCAIPEAAKRDQATQLAALQLDACRIATTMHALASPRPPHTLSTALAPSCPSC
jgi:hypothetical protein